MTEKRSAANREDEGAGNARNPGFFVCPPCGILVFENPTKTHLLVLTGPSNGSSATKKKPLCH